MRVNLGIAFIFSLFVCIRGHVVRLTDSDFREKLVEPEFAFVFFYMPGCFDCDKLAPHFDKAAKALESERPPVFFAQVDCLTTGKVTCDTLTVTTYPVIKVFKHGQLSYDYKGPHNADDMVSYIRSLVRPLTTELFSSEEVEKFKDHAEHSIIGFFEQKDSVIYERYEMFASTLNDRYRFAHTFDIDVRNHYGLNNTCIIYRSPRMKTTFEPDRIEYKGMYSPYKMRNWLLTTIHGLVGHRTPKNAADFTSPLVVIYYDVDFVKNPKGSNYWRNRVMKVAQKFSDDNRRVTFAVSNAAAFRHELNELELSADSANDKPIVVGKDEKDNRFVLTEPFSAESIEQFTEQLLTGALKPVKRQETATGNVAGKIKDKTTNEHREKSSFADKTEL